MQSLSLSRTFSGEGLSLKASGKIGYADVRLTTWLGEADVRFIMLPNVLVITNLVIPALTASRRMWRVPSTAVFSGCEMVGYTNGLQVLTSSVFLTGAIPGRGEATWIIALTPMIFI